MKIKNKIAIGCLVQFYEIDIIEDYLKSVKYAREDIENKENIEVDICLNLNQGLEKLDESKINMLDIKERMDTLVGDMWDILVLGIGLTRKGFTPLQIIEEILTIDIVN